MAKTTAEQRRNAYDYGIAPDEERAFILDADRLAKLEDGVIVREDVEAMGYAVPGNAVAYHTSGISGASWRCWQNGSEIDRDAPRILPDGTRHPAWIPVVSVRALLDGE